MLFVYIGIGGAAGAILRYLVSNWALMRLGTTIPTGTLAVNIIGSFFLGIIYAINIHAPLDNNLKGLVTVGLLGAFTTFSTFSNEIIVLLQSGNLRNGLVYLLLSILLGLAAVASGHYLVSFFLTLSKKNKSTDTAK